MNSGNCALINWHTYLWSFMFTSISLMFMCFMLFYVFSYFLMYFPMYFYVLLCAFSCHTEVWSTLAILSFPAGLPEWINELLSCGATFHNFDKILIYEPHIFWLLWLDFWLQVLGWKFFFRPLFALYFSFILGLVLMFVGGTSWWFWGFGE